MIPDDGQIIAAQAAKIRMLEAALAASVKLQTHYAELLNMHDGGKRKIFRSADEWIERLARLGMERSR